MANIRKTNCRLLLVFLLGGLMAACGQDNGAEGARNGGSNMAAQDSGPTRQEMRTWTGEKVYDEVCDLCHKMGVDGAPELGDHMAWAPRIAKGRDLLFEHVLQGFNKMPARGSCAFCSDKQLRAAMEYMLNNSGAL